MALSTKASSKKSAATGGHEEEDHRQSVKYANGFDVYFLGIAIVIGGQVFSWNAILAAGFWEAFLGTVLTGVAYICLILCLAEMSSALPFSGGSYGFVRVCLGPFFGYLIGCCEALQNIAYVASSVIPFAQMLTLVFKTDEKYEPGYWALFFGVSLFVNIMGGNVFWKFSRYMGIISLAIILMYIASTAQYGNFSTYSHHQFDDDYQFSGSRFMSYLPLAAWYFIGAESLPLSCVDCHIPAVEVPYGMIGCMLTLFVTAIGVFFTCVSQGPGLDDLASAALPFNGGFIRVFGLSDIEVTWFALPATFATGFGFMFAYGRQMCSMARSGLFPSIFRLRTSDTRAPYAALIFGSSLSVAAILAVYYTNLNYLTDLFMLCILASYSIYISVLSCYITFKFRYGNMTRRYENNFYVGMIAAVYGIGFYAMGIISVIGYQVEASSQPQLPLIVFCSYLGFLMLYYYFYGYNTQKLSEEEQKVMFKAYVINANVMKRKKTKITPSTVSTAQSNRSADGSVTAAIDHHVGPKKVDWHSEVIGVAVIEAARKKRESVCDMIPEDFEFGKEDTEFGKEQADFENPANPSHAGTESLPENKDIEEGPKVDEHSPTERTTRNVTTTTTDHQPAASNKRPLFSNRVVPFDFSSSHKDSTRDNAANGRPPAIMRKSITNSISEKFKEIIHEIKLVPLMDVSERQDYEALVLADMCGKLEPSSVGTSNDNTHEIEGTENPESNV